MVRIYCSIYSTFLNLDIDIDRAILRQYRIDIVLKSKKVTPKHHYVVYAFDFCDYACLL